MMPTLKVRQFGCAFLMLYLVVVGCRGITPPVEFYTLQSMAGTEQGQAGRKPADQISVGVGPLEIPKILDRPQIVTRSGANRISVAEFQRWGGALQDDFLRVLTENLSMLLETDRVLAYPWEDYFDPTFRLYLSVYRFDGTPGDEVVLSVTWAVTDRESRKILVMRNSVFKQAFPGSGFQDLVSTQSLLLADLSREIAGEIKRLRPSLPSAKE
jgi:uncharacterized lipoprotein YmbA